MRKAVEGLVEEGLLVKCPGKGTFLKQPNFESSLMRFFRLRNKQGDYIQPQGEIKKLVVIDAIPDINAKLKIESTAKLIYIERIRKNEDIVVLSERIWLPDSLFFNLKISNHIFYLKNYITILDTLPYIFSKILYF